MLEQSGKRRQKALREGETQLRWAAACLLAALLTACGSSHPGANSMMGAGAAGLAGVAGASGAGGSGSTAGVGHVGGAAGAGGSGSGGVGQLGGAGGVVSVAGMAGTAGSAGSGGAGGSPSLRCTGDNFMALCGPWCGPGFEPDCAVLGSCECRGPCDQVSPQAPRHGELVCPADANCSANGCVAAGDHQLGEKCLVFEQCALHTTCMSAPPSGFGYCYRLCDEVTGEPCPGSCKARQGVTNPSVCADAQDGPF